MFLMCLRANKYTHQMFCFVTVYVCVFLFGCGFRHSSFCCFCFCAMLDGWFFRLFLLSDKSWCTLPLCPVCLLLLFSLVLDTLAHSSYCRCLSHLRSRSSGFRGEYLVNIHERLVLLALPQPLQVSVHGSHHGPPPVLAGGGAV